MASWRTTPGVAEQMVDDWAAQGMRRILQFLTRHAEFEEYCRGRDAVAASEETPCTAPEQHR